VTPSVGADFSPPNTEREDRQLLHPGLMAQPKRLPGISYNQLYAYFVTTVTLNRVKAFDPTDFGPIVVTLLIEIATRFGFDVSAYVVMPDHVHFLVTPVRARLVELPIEYPLCGSTQYTNDEICEAVQMRGWWRRD
jgi:hypothetical protein